MKIVDLTQKIHSAMHMFPVYPQPLAVPWTKKEIQGFNAEIIHLSTHTGTHIDSPFHFYPKGRKINEVPIENFVRDAVVIDLTSIKPRAHITSQDIKMAEKKDGEIKRGDAVILKTGWEKHMNAPDYLTDYPGLSKGAAEYLASKGVSIVGVDTANIDHPEASDFAVHNTLLPKNILVVENLCNLDALGKTRFKFFALPLKIDGGTASPIRAIAILE